ncbi:UvrD-helicase domain-containing protein [Chitinivibrio alkaliphilus]|uniref:DNA 3'-5' helicase n=1 Tax=Chitinivibrio alkaliphilus ACht1 TaxID=1313304 RepID=U7DD09_9BACT|nr:UvrD-helicase domain-containing protein [Chitinivibrio alkaliphilus]ERP38771.1 superfamily i DNA/RNA helicase [Chitinivibrio alkaliphilus ACht1]
MEFTKQQQRIIEATGNLCINAVAGSGKTTTLVEYARRRPRLSKKLYIAFNAAVRREAQERFAAAGIENIHVQTAHSLAYAWVVRPGGYELAVHGYRPHEISRILSVQNNGSPHFEHILASHVEKFSAWFCNSTARKVQELDYRGCVSDPRARAFVDRYYTEIEYATRRFLALMDQKQIPCTHDFYLKKFQLMAPQLPYDYLLFDEGQDASPAMLDVFTRQEGTKVIVGDTHQQIYGWRFAVNSLEKVPYERYSLSTSFRFSPPIASLAREVIRWKDALEEGEDVEIVGAGNISEGTQRAVIARTNLGLLLRAISSVVRVEEKKKIYFEGNLTSYTYAAAGASLYDVLYLSLDKRERIRNRVIRSMGDLSDLLEYAKQTADMELLMLHEIVKTYGKDIFSILSVLHTRHVENRDEAELIFSTVHRCKGMEYDVVELADDFMTEEQFYQETKNPHRDPASKKALREEVNLLYVALTRTRGVLYLPSRLMPDRTDLSAIRAAEEPKGQGRSVLSLPKRGGRRYRPWTPQEDERLLAATDRKLRLREIARILDRSVGAVRSRQKKLHLR